MGGAQLELKGADNESACEADLVVVATPWDGAPQTVAGLADRLEGKVVISMANALFKVGDDIEAVVPARGSLCVAVQDAAPASPRLGRSSTTCLLAASRTWKSRSTPTSSSALTTRRRPRRPSSSWTAYRAVAGIDAGTLSAAAAIEAFTAVLIGVNIRHRAHASIRLTGLGSEGA